MSAHLQEWVAGVMVLVAAAWLLRRAWRRRSRATVCDGCERCPAAAAPPETPGTLVQLKSLDPR